MSFEELEKEQERCRKRVMEAFNAYSRSKSDLTNAEKDFESASNNLARRRAVDVNWDTFIKLAQDKNNWVQIKADDPLRDWLNCRNDDNCYYAEGITESKLLDFEALYAFKTVDGAFDGSFTLCDHCVDECEDYVDWWLSDMSDEWANYKSGSSSILIDPETLSKEGKMKVGYEPSEKKPKTN